MSAVDPAAILTLRGGLALLFAAAAWHKLRDLRGFRATLADHRLLPALAVAPFARALPAGEAALGAALVLPASARAAAAVAVIVLLVYTAAIAVNLARGRRHVACGCLGPAAEQPLHGGLVARNLVLVAAAAVAAGRAAPRSVGALDLVTVGSAVATLALLYVAADGLMASARWPEARS